MDQGKRTASIRCESLRNHPDYVNYAKRILWEEGDGLYCSLRKLNAAEWTERENHEKFVDYAVASFFELLRPRSVNWKGPNPSFEDMGWVSRIVSVLGRASQNARFQSIRAFLEGGVGLERMIKILSGESLSEKREVLLLVKANHRLKPKEFYAKLRGPLKDLGIELSSNPNSYPKQIERLKKQAQAYLATLSRSPRP